LIVIAVVAATAAGWTLKLQSPAIIAGLTAVFALLAAGGQSLRSDLRRFGWFSPALVLVMGGGPMLAPFPVPTGLLVAIVVFGSGLLPALGEHYRIGGQAFAAATLVSTTTGIGAGQSPSYLFGSALGGALLALLLRIVIGLSDSTRSTRFAVARTLVEPGPGVVERAATAWRADGRTVWLGRVLGGAARFRAARETLLAQAQQADRSEAERLGRIVAEADLVAAELATAIRAKACTGLPAPAREDPAEAVLRRGGRQDLPEAAQAINQALDRIRDAVTQRSTSAVAPPARGSRRQRVRGALQAHLSRRSSLFRHALRCTLAVGIGMVIVRLLHDPSASSLMLGLYLVLQPAARNSMSEALERTGAVVLGVVVLAALITLLPGAILLAPLVLAAMLLNIQRLRTDYPVLLAALIAVTVVSQATQLHRPLVNVAISFAADTAIGAAVALAVGYLSYLVLPSSLVPDVRGAIRVTVWAVSDLLRSVRGTGRGEDPRTAMKSTHVLALRRTQDLLGMPALLDGTAAESGDEHATNAAALALDALLQDVATLAFRPEDERALVLPALRTVDDLLAGRTTARVPDVPSESAPEAELLASALVESALHARAAIDQTLGYEAPWKRYTVSFVRPERLRIR
jgi:hypothetical protein